MSAQLDEQSELATLFRLRFSVLLSGVQFFGDCVGNVLKLLFQLLHAAGIPEFRKFITGRRPHGMPLVLLVPLANVV